MGKYYALCYVESTYLSDKGVQYTVLQKESQREPSMVAWQKELEKMGNCPTIARIMPARHAEDKYNIEGNYAYAKKALLKF